MRPPCAPSACASKGSVVPINTVGSKSTAAPSAMRSTSSHGASGADPAASATYSDCTPWKSCGVSTQYTAMPTSMAA